MKDLTGDANVESDCEPIEPVVPIITPAKPSTFPISSMVGVGRPQPPKPSTPTKPARDWDKMFLEVTDPRPPQYAPPAVKPESASWGKPAPVLPTLSRQKSHTPLVSIIHFNTELFTVVPATAHEGGVEAN